jgi:hypothetical protein
MIGVQFEATLCGQDEVPADVMSELSSVSYFLITFFLKYSLIFGFQVSPLRTIKLQNHIFMATN